MRLRFLVLPVVAAVLALSGSPAQATVVFVDSLGSSGFGSLAVLDDFEVFAPKDTSIFVPVSRFGLTYAPVTVCSTDCPGNIFVSSPGYANYGTPPTTSSILTANGNEFFTITPDSDLRRIGFDVYTINDPGNIFSVPGAVNVQVSVLTIAGTTSLSLAPPAGNFGFLGIVSDDPILQITWEANLGGVHNTGIDNVRVSDTVGSTVPEPATGLLALLGLAALAAQRRLRG
jgi:hypothetical protein